MEKNMTMNEIAELAKSLAESDPTVGHQNNAEILATMAAADNFNATTAAAQADVWMPW